ncbi:MAG: nitroreductase family protein [Actinomycetales bacterium]
MDFDEVLRRRRMVRAYQDRAVDEKVLDEVLRAGLRAPSAGFSQGWDFLVLTRAADRDLFWSTCSDPAATPDTWLRGMRTAPALVICLSDRDAYLDRYAEPDKGWTERDETDWPVPYWHTDTAMAAMLMLLAAVDRGLGACFFGVPATRHQAVLDAFGVPANRTPVGVVSFGHPAADLRSPSLRRGHRPVESVLHRGRFGAC